MRDLWSGAGVDAVEMQAITVERTFADFDDYWTTIVGWPSLGSKLTATASEDLALLKAGCARACRQTQPAVSPAAPVLTQ
jgi:hypothetical protein